MTVMNSKNAAAKKPEVAEELDLQPEVIVESPKNDPLKEVQEAMSDLPASTKEQVVAQRSDATAEQATERRQREMKVFAGPCPLNAAHSKTRVYNTKGVVRYCCCDDCGETWKKTGPEATA